MPHRLSLCAALLVSGAPASAATWWLNSQLAWHDNVTNAAEGRDVLPDLQWRGELAAGGVRLGEGGHRFRAAAGMQVESWRRYGGLDFAAPGVAVGWEFKPGLGPHRPVFRAEAEGEWRVARERARGGPEGAARVAVRQRIGRQWLLDVGHEWRRFDARGLAFARTSEEVFGRMEWIAAGPWSLAVEARARRGDVVSYSRPPRPDLEALGKPITRVDTFGEPVPWIAYYFEARTTRAAVELQRRIGRATLAWRHEHRLTEHAGPSYTNRITSLRLAVGF